jgi:threonine dehydratase
MNNEQVKPDYLPRVQNIQEASVRLKAVAEHTPLVKNLNLSETYGASVFLKREDLQLVRSYKIRGAYNKISSLAPEELKNGVVCASAGNHAQGVAYSCRKLGIRGTVFMPSPTPSQKIRQVKMFGKDMVDIVLEGDTYDDAHKMALDFCNRTLKNISTTFLFPLEVADWRPAFQAFLKP